MPLPATATPCEQMKRFSPARSRAPLGSLDEPTRDKLLDGSHAPGGQRKEHGIEFTEVADAELPSEILRDRSVSEAGDARRRHTADRFGTQIDQLVVTFPRRLIQRYESPV